MGKTEKIADIARSLTTAKGVATHDFEKACEALRRRIKRAAESGVIDTSLTKDAEGRLVTDEPSAIYTWAATLKGYETVRAQGVKHTAQASVRASVQLDAYQDPSVLEIEGLREESRRLKVKVKLLELEISQLRERKARGKKYGGIRH
jgi:hypothetical protein